MKFTDVLVLLFMLIFLETGILCGLSSYWKINERIEKKNRELTSLRFVPESFKKTCRWEGFSDLVEWQKCCKALWNLAYIGWCNAETFMDLSETENSRLMYGTWIGESGKGEVYCRVSTY